MMDRTRFEGLDAVEASDALAASTRKILAAEAEQFFLAAHWADLHAPEFVQDHAPRALPGTERVVWSGADGTPQIGEFAAAELAALLGRSTGAGEQLVADAVNVRHRHPLLWSGIEAGAVRVWVAVRVARRCASAELSLDQARWVDAETTPYAATLPLGRFFELVDARIAAADPESAAARADRAARRRFVSLGRTDEHGLRTLVARARAGDVVHLVAVLDRIAEVLALQGMPGDVDERRAAALKILANPARALALLTGSLLDVVDGVEPEAQEPAVPGRRVTARDQTLLLDTDGVPVMFAPPSRCPGEGRDEGGGSILDPALLQRLVGALADVDFTALDPVVVIHAHASAETIRDGTGVVRGEGVGPINSAELRAWLGEPFTGARIELRPVLDAIAVTPVDRYEIPGRMRELVFSRLPYEVFPFGTRVSRACDLDHVRPYDADGPPGQTDPEKLAPLGRFHHRLKTFGGWQIHHPRPQEYWWRTPTGHWFSVTDEGTRHHGRDPHHLPV